MIYAVGQPGQMPRIWVETKNYEQAEAQLQPGEVLSDSVTLGANGAPIAEALPTADQG